MEYCQQGNSMGDRGSLEGETASLHSSIKQKYYIKYHRRSTIPLNMKIVIRLLIAIILWHKSKKKCTKNENLLNIFTSFADMVSLAKIKCYCTEKTCEATGYCESDWCVVGIQKSSGQVNRY